MEYTEQQIKAAVVIFGDAIIKNLTTGTVPLYKNADDIDIEFEVEELLNKHCLVCGNMDDISKYVADRIQCTVSERMGNFICKTTEASDFLKRGIEEYVCGTLSLYKPDSLYSCIGDLLPDTFYRYWDEDDDLGVNTVYFLMDFTNADYWYADQIDNHQWLGEVVDAVSLGIDEYYTRR